MKDFIIKKRHRRPHKEIPLAPVLDLLTVVIFFLMLSTSFIELTKQTLPPSSVSKVSDPATPAPVTLKLFVLLKGGIFGLAFHWSGETPGVERISLQENPNEPLRSHQLRAFSREFSAKLKNKFPGESSVQLGLGGNFTYQDTISVMDGVREVFEDLVLVSPQDAEADAQGG